MFLQFLTFLLLLTLVSVTASDTNPERMDVCGNVSVPYPFGVKDENCNAQAGLVLCCDKSISPPVLRYGNIPVLEISLDGTMTVSLGVSYDCYEHGNRFSYKQWKTTLSKLFTFSNTRNMFTAIGCDTFAIMEDNDGEIFKSGCLSVCGSEGNVGEGLCSGIGCCQTAIPNGLKTLNVSLTSLYNYTHSPNFNPCSYAFLTDSKMFNLSRSDILNFTTKVPKVEDNLSFPAVLEWVVGIETCEKAERNLSGYACRKNTDCVNSKNGPGYRCNCKEGYEGNPYSTNGCEDIDECKYNPCEATCTNTIGKFKCSCPYGSLDNGAKDGVRCIKLPILQMGLGIGLGLLVLICVGCWMSRGLKRRRRRQQKAKLFQQNGGLLLQNQISRHGGNKLAASVFTSDELKQATNNYTEILGHGGYGTVYKGALPNKTIVAIKKSKIVDKSQIDQFINEFLILTQVNHPNVVKLLGCCLETEVPALVYEYVSNGNLFHHIHQNTGGVLLSWENRLRIASEIARALTYLHYEPSMPIIHRDVKTANILLDDQFKVKVADFGISKLVQLDQTQMATLIQGTVGYLDPEYITSHQLTEKSDVFGLGVVLVELLTGKKPICSQRSPEDRSLATYFTTSLKRNRLFQLVEPHIIDEGNSKQIKAYAELTKRCLSWKSEDRPTMKEVAMELDELRKFESHPWIPQRNEESQCLFSETQDVYFIESSSDTGEASGQYSMSMDGLSMNGRPEESI